MVWIRIYHRKIRTSITIIVSYSFASLHLKNKLYLITFCFTKIYIYYWKKDKSNIYDLIYEKKKKNEIKVEIEWVTAVSGSVGTHRHALRRRMVVTWLGMQCLKKKKIKKFTCNCNTFMAKKPFKKLTFQIYFRTYIKHT